MNLIELSWRETSNALNMTGTVGQRQLNTSLTNQLLATEKSGFGIRAASTTTLINTISIVTYEGRSLFPQ